MSPNHHRESPLDCDTIQELIPEYAFGLTTPEETQLVDASLAACPEAAAQLADYRRIQDEMRASVPQIAPPPQLEARLMAAIAPPNTSAKLRRALHPAWLAAAAALIILLLTNIYWLFRLNELEQRQDELAAQIVATPDTNRPFIWRSSANLRSVRLPPSEENANASAFLMWNAESKIGLLYARGFPELATGQTYQLWLTRGEERVNAGTFRVDEEGTGALLFRIPDPIDEYTWARITEEPDRGSDQPTGTVVVVGEL